MLGSILSGVEIIASINMSVLQDELKTFTSEVATSLAEWQKLRRINRNWDGGLTIATIVLTLTMTIIGIDAQTINRFCMELDR
jgi:hypothetical protein